MQKTSRVTQPKLPCPKCPSSDAYHLYDDGHGYCYSCTYYKPPIEDALDEIFTYEYLSHRGLTRNTLEFYDIKTKVNADGQPITVGFRYPWGEYKVRSLAEKDFKWKPAKTRAGLYGRDKFTAGAAKSITLTEGEYDAATIYQVLGSPAVSVTSASAAVSDVVADRSWVDAYERIYLAFDNDAAGREATKAVARLFDYNKVYVLNFDRRKDANEFLQVEEEHELRSIWLNAKRFLPETIVTVNKANIEELLGEDPTWGAPYPFAKLNEMTYGIRRGESVLITAQEGVGKTELMHAIEFNLLKETDDAIAAIYLEESKRDHLQRLAGIQLQKPVHLPDAGVARADLVHAIASTVKVDERLHVYNHFGSDDPDILLDTIRFLVTCRNVVYVFLDHLGIVVSGLGDTKDQTRALDYLSTRLAMLIKELNFALIFVSHVNDVGQTRGSRLIAKDAHVRMDISRDVLNPDPKTRGTINVVVSKNRPIGRTGYAGSYYFDPYRRQYEEVGDGQSFGLPFVPGGVPQVPFSQPQFV